MKMAEIKMVNEKKIKMEATIDETMCEFINIHQLLLNNNLQFI